jgi:Helix-turn-helix domain
MTSHADLSEPNRVAIDDRAASGPAQPVGGLPDFLTVVEAARLLRIGRTSAYVLAQRWLYTDGREGLPVVRVGRQLRVPRRALEGLAGGELTAPEPPSSSPAVGASEPSTRTPDDDDAHTFATPHNTDRAPIGSPRSERSDGRSAQAPLFPTNG